MKNSERLRAGNEGKLLKSMHEARLAISDLPPAMGKMLSEILEEIENDLIVQQ